MEREALTLLGTNRVNHSKDIETRASCRPAINVIAHKHVPHDGWD
jgi:hypothetical protein